MSSAGDRSEASAVETVPSPIDIDRPRWDQSRFLGRLNHFARVCNPFLLLKPRAEYERSRELVEQARTGQVPKGTTVEQLYAAKVLYDSAYHPDSGDKMTMMGRMSAQVPGGMVIIGILLAYYKTTTQVILGQWINQSFNAMVNYTNRNAKSNITDRQIAVAYVGATSGAVIVSVGMNLMVKRSPPIFKRWVPCVATAAANCINIPVMRQRELIDGVAVLNEEGKTLAHSKRAAAKGVSLTVFSRICIASPIMILVPVVMQKLERYRFFNRGLVFSAGVQILLSGLCLFFSVPLSCSLFPQRNSMKTANLEESAQREVKANSMGGKVPERVYFNKGL